MHLTKQRTLLAFAALLVLSCGSCSKESPSPNANPSAKSVPSPVASPIPVANLFPEAKSLRLFVEADIGKDGTPIYTEAIGRLLNPAQRRAFEATLQIAPLPEEMAACFIPHHFFRYFDGKGRLIGEIEVCFCCAGTRISGRSGLKIGADQELQFDYNALKTFVSSLNEPVDVMCE